MLQCALQLDILRAVAVFMVLGFHMQPAPRDWSWLAVWPGDFLRAYGHLGVDLFFVLSGFLVAGLLFREQQTKGSMNVGRFLIRRGLARFPNEPILVSSRVYQKEIVETITRGLKLPNEAITLYD